MNGLNHGQELLWSIGRNKMLCHLLLIFALSYDFSFVFHILVGTEQKSINSARIYRQVLIFNDIDFTEKILVGE